MRIWRRENHGAAEPYYSRVFAVQELRRDRRDPTNFGLVIVKHVLGRLVAGKEVKVGEIFQNRGVCNQDGGLMQRVVRTAKGEEIQWYRQPQWNSSTRTCRAILDLSDRDDRNSATFLAGRIEKENNSFSLIEGV